MKKKQKKKKSTYTRKKIMDEFTSMPISRQQKWQLAARAKEGALCDLRGAQGDQQWVHCLKHAIATFIGNGLGKYSGSVRREQDSDL